MYVYWEKVLKGSVREIPKGPSSVPCGTPSNGCVWKALSKRDPGVCEQEDRGRETDRQGLQGLMRLLATGKEQGNSTGRLLPSYLREEVR